MKEKRVLVTGAGGPAAHNFIQSLRLSGEKYYIVGTDINKYHIELSPCDKRYLVPRCDAPSYIDVLNRIIETEKIDLVHPQPDVEVAVISENREKLSAKTFLPKKETVRLCQDKMALNKKLEKEGFVRPIAYRIDKPEDIEKHLPELLERYPEKAWLRATRGAGSRAALPIRKAEHGIAWIEYWKEMRGIGWGDFMLSEYLPGREIAFQSIWKDGEIITSQARERIEYVFGHLTPSGQSSSPSVARTIHRDDVNRMVTEAIRAIDPEATGIFCVDIKENVEGEPCITEINCGRFFTTSNFFTVAGSNMPHYYVKMALGEEIPPLPKYNAIPEGIYWIRNIDCGQKMVREGEWTSTDLRDEK